MALLTFLLSDTLDTPATGSDLHKEQYTKSHMHPKDTVIVVLKLKDVLRLKSIPTKDDLHKLLQQQELLRLPLLQNQQKVP